MIHSTVEISTPGRGARDITAQIQRLISDSGVQSGLCQIFIHHTSASLMLCENADPDVLTDMESFMARIAPDGDPAFVHDAEGPDDMPAHIRSVITHSHLSIPIARGQCDLGTWQGIFIWEHRHRAHTRRLTITLIGT